MEFDKSRVYTALNADELHEGDKVIVADDLSTLKEKVKKGEDIETIREIYPEDCQERFDVEIRYTLAYLVERAENCTNCEGCGEGVDPSDERTKIMVCSQWKPKAEINLCDTCKDNFCECPAIGDNIKFGNGKGNDNVIECKCYKPKTEKEDNMWNYESLPERQEIGTSDRVVVAVRGYNIVDIGYYDYDLEGWFVEGCRYPVRVYAWQSIKPPREEE